MAKLNLDMKIRADKLSKKPKHKVWGPLSQSQMVLEFWSKTCAQGMCMPCSFKQAIAQA